MSPRSSLFRLPDEVRKEFERKLVARGFSGYEALCAWLKERGFAISSSAAKRYGQRFEARLAAIRIASEQAKAIAGAVGDDGGAVGETLMRLCQRKALDVLMSMEDEEKADFPKMGAMIASLDRAAIAREKWAAECRAKAKSAAEEVVKAARGGGLSEEKAEEIRKKILGIV